MNLWRIAWRGFQFYKSTNLAIALGVAAATAVLTGALIVGDSMRQSLRELTLERLGKIDEMLISEGFFRSQLANEMKSLPIFQQHYDRAEPAILFPGGTVQTGQPGLNPGEESDVRRAGQVTVLGIGNPFWDFEIDREARELSETLNEFSGNVAILNQTLADDLGIDAAEVQAGQATVTVRIPKQTQLPADSFLGRKTDLIESLVDLQVVQIIPTTGLGRFGMFPSQADPANIYVPIGLLQDALSRSVLSHKTDLDQANVLLLSGAGQTLPAPEVTSQLRSQLRPTMEDYGLQLKHVRQFVGAADDRELVFEYWSLSSDRMLLADGAATAIARALPDAKPVFTYMANDIRPSGQLSGVPFSMVAGIDIDQRFQPLSSISGQPVDPPADDEIMLNQWAANDLGVKPGDSIEVTFFEPETTHGSQVERTVEFRLADVVKLAEPERSFVSRGRRGLEPAVYQQRPTQANDPDLTPEVPGVTDAATIEEWELPFETAERMRPQDDDYWDDYRTTPKAFVNLATAQKLFDSRFGKTTSFRIPMATGDREAISQRLLNQFASDQVRLGIHLVPVKRRGLQASSGSTPFDVLFLALSMFVIGAALILVSLLFRLGLQQRAEQVGLMKASGFSSSRLRRTWLLEMVLVSGVGSLLGLGLGVGYASLMIKGLTSWWVGAISRPFLTMHLTGISLAVGLISGLIICVLTIAWSLRRADQQSVVQLLRGNLESNHSRLRHQRASWIADAVAWLSALIALGLAMSATWLSGEAQAGAFMGAGFLMLVSGLIWVYRWLTKPGKADDAASLSLSRMALLSTRRNPLRSTLTIGLVAVASFLIAAVSAFRLKPTEAGTAGFDWVAQSSQPVFDDLATVAGQQAALGEGFRLPTESEVLMLRYKSGEDASCNNLYQSTQPRALGVTSRFAEQFSQPDEPGFAWAGAATTGNAETSNPWLMLNSGSVHQGTEDDPVPVVIDKNTANYSLKIYSLGTVREVEYDTGERFHFKVVGFLANTILQGSLIMSEQDFESVFPTVAGYQYFLIRDPGSEAASSKSISILEDRLGDQGFDARSADQLLANFMAVQNTYLTTFQTLGALGLLLGTFGLSAVQIRSVLERQSEMGLLRAVGFELSKLSSMVMLENAWLLAAGLGVGIGAALFTTVPHYLSGAASVPWSALGLIFASIAVVGLLAGWVASRRIAKMPILEALKR